MNSYVTLGGKKLKVFHQNWSADVVQPKQIVRLPTGSAIKQFGQSFRVWSFVAKVPVVPEAGYASLADVVSWFSSNTNAGNLLTFVDPFNASYQVFIANDLQGAESLSPMADSSSNYYYVKFVLEQAQ